MFGKSKKPSGTAEIPQAEGAAEPVAQNSGSGNAVFTRPDPLGLTGRGTANEFGRRGLDANLTAPRRNDSRHSPTEGRKLVVGREICLSGEIKSCERLVVEGQVEANLTDCQILEISKPGLFRGSAVVDHCEISGVFEGDLTVRGLLTIYGSGRVIGSLRYGELEIERGGRVTGDMVLIDEQDSAEQAVAVSDYAVPVDSAEPAAEMIVDLETGSDDQALEGMPRSSAV